ncbi:hypothetical protein HPB48_006097 [Haemaphysalis longicornis]|uniref:Uncharacterized protein n=1 Tax=Haemaphysalis longicornis TaxID=44386 RepID=A0A9J6GUZ4_HAELO|nr:hypothetical protein HPB48_006097 [Haemaphysalis longicornis]
MEIAMTVEVEAAEILPEQVSKALGWKTAGEKLKQKTNGRLSGTLPPKECQDGGGPTNTDSRRGTQDSGAPGGASGGDPRHRRARSLNKGRVLRATRMPDLPRDAINIVMRPRGGLQVFEVSRVEISRAITAAAKVGGVAAKDDVVCPNRQQNIVIVSTPKRENADKYALVERLAIDRTSHEMSAYESPHGSVKGVIRGVPLTDTAREIQELVIHEHDPSPLLASRIGKTTSVVIAFAWSKVANYVQYENLPVECSLYRKQIDQCGRVGHRMNVCPNPQNRICRGWGVANPDSKPTCNTKTGLQSPFQHLLRTAAPALEAPTGRSRKKSITQWSYRATPTQQQPSPRVGNTDPQGGHQSRGRSTSRGPRSAGRTPSDSHSGRHRVPTSGGAKGDRSSSRRRWSRSRPKSNSRAGSLQQRNAEKQAGWTDRSSVGLASEKEFPPFLSNESAPTAECRECADLERLIEKQNAQIQQQYLQIRALMEKMDALASGKIAGAVLSNEACGDASTKRKVPRWDPAPLPDREAEPSTSSSPRHEKMDAETSKPEGASLEPSQMQQLQDGMVAVLEAVNQLTRAELHANEAGAPRVRNGKPEARNGRD